MVIVEPFHKHRTKKRKKCELSLSHGCMSLLTEERWSDNDTGFVRLNLREIFLDEETGFDTMKGERSSIEMTGEEAKDLAKRILGIIERGNF